jgi:hypothetical protein
MSRTLSAVSALVGGALLLSACGSSTPTASTSTTSTTVATTTATSHDSTRNLLLTPSVRQSLLAAGAASHRLPVSDYTGLAPGTAYYAIDPSTSTYYAAAGIDANPNSLQAQIGDQDDGGYLLFTRPVGSNKWTVYNDGLGAAQDAICPIKIPAAVLAVWNWRPKSCYPPQSP